MNNDDRNKLSRRGFLKGTAAASLGTVAAGTIAPAAAQTSPPPPMPPHGTELRGISLPAKQPTAEARFGYMIKSMPAYAPADSFVTYQPGPGGTFEPLKLLGQKMTEFQGTSIPFNPDENDTWNENPNEMMTAGITFLGQFVDHDITVDRTPLAQQVADPDAVKNFRSPRYDLDALYGGGPVAEPQLYGLQGGGKADYTKFQIRPNSPGVEDIPRHSDGKAIIADPRNDQHMIIAQMHLAFMKFHNRLVDYSRGMRLPEAGVFESSRRLARWLYQWVIIHHFLPAVVGPTMRDAVYKDVPGTGKAPIINLKFYKPRDKTKPFIPIEFAVAAFRFGHSLARPRYTVSETLWPNPSTEVLEPVSKIRCFRTMVTPKTS